MKYLVYMSTAVLPLNSADLRQLLRQSQAYNVVNGITGMLLYSDGSFVQALEGFTEDIDKLFKTIVKDRRHKNIIPLVTGKLYERIFPSWSMGFKNVSATDFSRFDAYIDAAHHGIWTGEDIQHPVVTLLRSFASSNNF